MLSELSMMNRTSTASHVPIARPHAGAVVLDEDDSLVLDGSPLSVVSGVVVELDDVDIDTVVDVLGSLVPSVPGADPC
jgi:hypothetical protein